MLKIKVTKLPGSLVEIEGELPADIFEAYFPKALKKISGNLELPGFRKGKAPENVLLSKIPEIKILEEMAELALSEHYPKILSEEKIDAISQPAISITKLARKNPLGFKIKTAVLPEIKLPDYKDLAKKIAQAEKSEDKDIDVTEKEMEDTIMDIRKSRAKKVHMGDATPPETSPSQGEEGKIPEPELPEFNDEFVQALGPFKDIEDFKTKLKENIKLEKANQAKEKTRLKIIEGIIKESILEVPEILTDLEVNKILYRMESDIAQMGIKFEDYLKHLNKTVEDLRKEFRPEAEKRAKLSLILSEISKAENISATPEEVAPEVTKILKQYKEADPERAEAHVASVLTNEKIFQFLEAQ